MRLGDDGDARPCSTSATSQRRRRAGPARPGVRPGRRPRLRRLHRPSTATRTIDEYPVDRRRHVRPATRRATVLVDRPAVRQPQRRRRRVRARRAALHRHGRRRRGRRPRAAGHRPRRRCSASSCASIRRRPAAEPYTVPADNPFVGDAGRARRRSGRSGCATRGASRSTGDRRPVDRRRRPGRDRGGRRRPGHRRRRRRQGAQLRLERVRGQRPLQRRPVRRRRRRRRSRRTRTATRGCSVSGGVRVPRRPASPALDGWYVFGDYCTGEVWASPVSGEGDAITVGRRGASLGDGAVG